MRGLQLDVDGVWRHENEPHALCEQPRILVRLHIGLRVRRRLFHLVELLRDPVQEPQIEHGQLARRSELVDLSVDARRLAGDQGIEVKYRCLWGHEMGSLRLRCER